MDNNNTPYVVSNADNNGSSSVVATPVIDIGPTSVMESNDSDRQPPMTAEAQQELVDMLMTVEETDDMPSLHEASVTESDIENIVIAPNLAAHVPISEQNNDVLSASSQSTAFSTPSPPSSSSSPTPQRSNRRARVEDDIDENRDRRHPSQRVGANDQPSASNAPPNSFYGPFFTSFRDAGAALGLGLGNGFFNRTTTANPGNSTTPNINFNDSNPNPTPGATTSSSQSQNQGPPQNAGGATDRRPPVHVVDYEFSIVMDGSRRPQPVQGTHNQAPALNDPDVQGQPGGNAPTSTPSGPTVAGAAGAPPNISFNPPIPLGNLATLLGVPFPLPGGGFGFPPMPEEKEDPERARKLVDGLDEVPVGLVRRLEKVGTGGGGMGEDVSKGGDVGCAVCWDRLLPEEVKQDQTEEPRGGSEGMLVDEEAGTEEEHPKSKHPNIVSLPCAHVFHAECLMPWFSRPRHTTCPTCRFNIDPDNLTYVSARQRRQEQQRTANDNTDDDDLNQPSEDTTGERPAFPAFASPAAAATPDAGEQPPQPQGRGVDLGSGFAGIIQMLNAQGQPQQPAAAAPDNVAVPSGEGPPPPIMPMPMAIGGTGNFFPAGFAVGQLPMPMPIPVPFMAVPLQLGNAEGIPMPMPWRMANPLHMATGGGTRTNATDAHRSDANDANATPATTMNEPSSSNAANAPQAQAQPPPHRPAIDVIRISVDMVFDGRPMRPANRVPTNNSAVPQPSGGNADPLQGAHNATQEQLNDANEDHDFDGEPPELLSLELSEEQDRQITELLDRRMRSRQNHANGENTPTPAPNNNSEQTAPQTQPAEPGPQFHGPPGYSLGDIHVAGTGRSFEEAFTQALSRLQDQIAQPRQEGQNPQPADAAPADENPPPPQQTQAGVGAQGQGHPPWHFMPLPMPFMNFGIPMRAPQPEGPKRAWAPPPPPGPTLRQRIEQREWEAGLRCHDVSCGLGPSDEDPLGDDICDTLRKGQQLAILSNEDGEGERKPVCEHRFHGTCLVSAERVALRGAEVIMNEAGGVEVSCPVCRGAGCVTKAQWDEGVLALQ